MEVYRVFHNMYVLVFLFAYVLAPIEGAGFSVAKDKTTIAVGDTIIITCTKNTALTEGIQWQKTGTVGALTRCLHTMDTCVPSAMANLRFTSVVANREFKITITNAGEADSGTYTCKDTDEDGSIAIEIEVPTTAASYGPARSDEKDGLSGWEIAGVVIGSIVGVVWLALAIYLVRRQLR